MSQMILPGVYITEHAEGLIAPGQITIGNIGVVGTAAKGAVLTPILLGSFQDAVQEFYTYGPWLDDTGQVNSNALTLVRALEQAFAFGATTVYAVRVSKTDAQLQPAATAASASLKAGGGLGVTLQANQPGTWGNHLSVKVEIQKGVEPFIDSEVVPISGPQAFKLRRPIDLQSARNKVVLTNGSVVTNLTVVNRAPKPGNGEVQIDPSGKLIFPGGEQPKAPAILTVNYMVKADARLVTINFDQASEVYSVADGEDLAAQVTTESSWVNATPDPANQFQPLSEVLTPVFLKGGDDAAGSANYQAGLDALLNSDVQIVLAAGQDQSFGNALQRHCDLASSDTIKSERIAIVGTGLIDSGQAIPPRQSNVDTFFDKVVGHNLASDRVIFVTPGIQAVDTPTQTEVTLPGSYAAAAVAGLISTFDPEVSPTNKTLAVDTLEYAFDAAHLTELVRARVLALESRSGFRIVKGITADTSGAFSQISIRRIVDYAKRGVRSAAEPYIGLLNDDRVRGAMHATINSFLAEMLNDEMLESYDLDVSATREEEIQGIARVTMTLQPVFSIDFIVVDMFLG
jgi:hypothetical protein